MLFGRNNAGKIALLPGVSIINAIARRQAPSGNPEQYCVVRERQRELLVRVLFSLDRRDGPRFGWSNNTWETLVAEKKACLALRSVSFEPATAGRNGAERRRHGGDSPC